MRTALQSSQRCLRLLSALLVCALLGAAVVAAPARALAPDDEEAELEDLEAFETIEQSDPHMRTRLVDSHDPTRAAHPLRIAAYALHPVGVTLDWVIVRPATWVVKREPFRTLFGYTD
jgi:hypothetical protein